MQNVGRIASSSCWRFTPSSRQRTTLFRSVGTFEDNLSLVQEAVLEIVALCVREVVALGGSGAGGGVGKGCPAERSGFLDGYGGGFGTLSEGGPAGGIGVALDVAGVDEEVARGVSVILLLLSFFTVVSVTDAALCFFTVVSVDDFGSSFTFTVVSVLAYDSKPFGGAFGGGSVAQAGGGFVFA